MTTDQGPPPKDAPAGTGGRRRQPVTIDLEAEAAAESGPPTGDAPAPAEPASSEATKSWPSVPALLLAGVVGGIVAVAAGYGLQVAGVLPSPIAGDVAQTRTEVAGVSDAMTALDQRLTAIEAGNAQSIADRALLDDLSRQVGVVDAFGTSLSDRLLAAEASIAALEEGDDTGDADDMQRLDDLTKRIAALESAPPPGDDPSPQLAQLAERVAALESAAASREAAVASEPPAASPGPAASPSEDEAAAGAAGIAALRQAAAGSSPFAAELNQLGDGAIAPATRTALLPLAEKGAPTRAELIAEFPTVAAAIVADEPVADSDGGLLGLVASYGRRLVTVRPAGSQSGDEAEAVVSRMRTAVAAGDLAAALAARKDLPQQGKAISEGWAKAVADRLEIERLLGDIPAAAEPAGGSG